jgi:hypothetical protein
MNYKDWFNSGHLGVTGMLQRAGARALLTVLSAQEQNNITGSIAEIGTYHGRTFIGLALAARLDETVLAVDVFKDDGKPFRAEFDNNVHLHLPANRRVVVLDRGSHAITPPAWAAALGAPARLVHIDGNHARKSVLYDFALAASHLSPCGVIVVDDFCNEFFPDVTIATVEALHAHPHIQPLVLVPRFGSHRDGGAKLICATRNCDYKPAFVKNFPQHHLVAAELGDDVINVLRDN